MTKRTHKTKEMHEVFPTHEHAQPTGSGYICPVCHTQWNAGTATPPCVAGYNKPSGPPNTITPLGYIGRATVLLILLSALLYGGIMIGVRIGEAFR